MILRQPFKNASSLGQRFDRKFAVVKKSGQNFMRYFIQSARLWTEVGRLMLASDALPVPMWYDDVEGALYYAKFRGSNQSARIEILNAAGDLIEANPRCWCGSGMEILSVRCRKLPKRHA